ncbi:MAG: alpha/beta fold hydrolase [Candidatus Eremiobacterota bacterium]
MNTAATVAVGGHPPTRYTPARAWRWIGLMSGRESVPIGITPKDPIYERDRLVVYRYRRDTPPRHSVPLLLVYSLINRPSVLDLRPGRSVVENLLAQGYDVYLLDWGVPDALDQCLDLDAYVNFLLRAAVREVCRHSGQDQISLLGYCMGGTLTAMYAALHPERVKNLLLLGAPFHFRSDKLLYQWGTDPTLFDPQKVVDAFGNAPPWSFEGFSLLTIDQKPSRLVAMFDHLHDVGFMDSYLAMEQWVSDNIPMAGAVYAEFIQACFHENRLIQGRMSVGGQPVDLGSIECPTLIIVGESDHLVPPETSSPLADLLPNAQVLSFPSGHIGLSVSGASQRKLWPQVGAWLAENSECNPPATPRV